MKLKGLVGTIAMALVAALSIPVQLAGQERLEGKGHHRYKLIDLGTFGGPASYFPNGFDGFLNNHGWRGHVVTFVMLFRVPCVPVARRDAD